MFLETQPSSYYSGCNRMLQQAVPPRARRVLEVGCTEGHLGAALKHQRSDRTVFGIERQPGVAARAAERLDRVFSIDVATDDPPLEPHSVDCILFGDVLEHLVDPEAVLRRFRRFLAPDGIVLRGSRDTKMITDVIPTRKRGGSVSRFRSSNEEQSPVPGAVVMNGFAREERMPNVILPVPMTIGPTPGIMPLSFVVGVTDIEILQNNFMASPCVTEAGSPHEVILVRGGPNVTAKISTVSIFVFRRMKRAWRRLRWRLCASIIPATSGWVRGSMKARRSSPANGATGCRSPRRA